MAPPVLGACLDLVLEDRLDEASAALAQEVARHRRSPERIARPAALGSFAAVMHGHQVTARRLADVAAAAALPTDAPARAYATAAATFVACLLPPVEGEPARDPFILLWDNRDAFVGLSEEDGCVAGYLAIEAAMSSGRLREAQESATAYLACQWHSSVQAPIMAEVALARSLVFQGQLVDASASIARATILAEARGGLSVRLLTAATAAYVAAQREDCAEVLRLTEFVTALEPEPATYMTVGAHVLCAYGLAAVGEGARAAEILLHAGGGPTLPRLQTVDRAYAYELLATDAIDRDDLTAARAWGRRVVPLQIHDMAAAAAQRTLSRIDVAMGRSASGAERAAVSSARALIAGGRLDAARSRVLEASALAAGGERGAAAAGFRHAAQDADLLGAVAVRNWSARELRRLGRRLRPVAGAGWQVLSQREQQIALLAAEGYSNRMIGQALYLSERTVQSHLSRALLALGAASRAAIPASLGRERGSDDTLDGLTLRQQQVAWLVAEGCSNRIISQRLAISDKTVEKHVQAIFTRWHVSSRTAIANRVLSPLPAPEGRLA